MLSVFGDIERLLADLYPYRYVITPLLLLAVVGVLAIAVKRGVHHVLWRHRLATAAVGGPLLLLLVVAGTQLLSPLWQRSALNETSPLAIPAQVRAESPAGATGASFTVATSHKGRFRGADSLHFGRGDALIISTGPQMRVLRFENFSVLNGPDLYVYLSHDETGRRVEEALNLGRLKATDGAFNYEIPSGIDLAGIKSVVVWCKQFGVLFAVAPLMEA